MRPLNIHSGDCGTAYEWLSHVLDDLDGAIRYASHVCLMGYSSGGVLVRLLQEELTRREFHVAAVVLLDPTSGQPEEALGSLQQVVWSVD